MKRKLIWLVLVAASAVALRFWGCKSDSTNPYGTTSGTRSTSPNTVTMANISFSPSSLTITKGTTVTWINNDNVVHTSTSDTGVWSTGDIPPGGSKTTTFNTSGTFKYHCIYHVASGMTGTIVVQ